MNRSLIVMLACAGLVAAPARASQDLAVYLQAGWAYPTDPPEFGELWDSAVSFGGGVGVRLSPEWELVGAIHWQTFAANLAAHQRDLLLVSPSGQPAEIRSMDGRDARIATLMGELRFHVPTRSPRFSPFLSFGAGYFDMSLSASTFIPDTAGTQVARFPEESDSGLAASIGGGFGWRISSRVDLMLDCIYTVGFTEGLSTQFLPLRIGVGIDIG